MVHPKGRAFAAPGTWLSADFASTSWKVSPANSGVCTERTRLLRRASPGRASSRSTPSSCPLHLIPTFEHTFYPSSSGARERELRTLPATPQPPVVARHDDRAGIAPEGLLELGGESEREVVGRLVEQKR